MEQSTTPEQALAILLRALRLPSFAASYELTAAQAEREGWTFGQYLRVLCELELADRRERRICRLFKQSELPASKTLATLERRKLPAKVASTLPRLCTGSFLDKAENVLVFGLPGRGKTHLVSAIGHELVRSGRAVLFTPTYRLVQRLLKAKRDLTLERELGRLDRFDAVILDDIGYVQQDRDEMEVLFTFLAQRYERKSVLITSNIVFSQWDRIFKNPMTTAAAIDRLVHHSTVLEMTGESIRTQEAKANQQRRSPASQEQPQL
jgi:DNA replication protein DnaC